MENQVLTAQDLSKFGTYQRLAYILKQPGIVAPDVPTEGRNKLYSLPMGIKWAFFTHFDGKFSVAEANAIADVSMGCIPWMIEAELNSETKGQRLWFVVLDDVFLFTGRSGVELQPEEREQLACFTLFSAYYWPEAETNIWCTPNSWILPASGASGSGAGNFQIIKPKTPIFTPQRTSLSKSVSFYCISDVFEKIASTFGVHPYKLDVEDFNNFAKGQMFDVEKLVLKLK